MFKSFFRLTRFEHAIMFSIAVLIGSLISGGYNLISLIIPIFSEIFAFVHNDLVDIESDRINKKNRPLVNGEISVFTAKIIMLLSLIVSLILAFFVNHTIFFLTCFLLIASYLYNTKLKDLPLIGNLFIAFTMGIPFIYGNLSITEKICAPNIILFFIGLFAGLGREIIKTIEDMEGDKKARNSHSLPFLIGVKNSIILAKICFIFLILISFVPLFLFKNKIPYILVFISILGIIKNIFDLDKYKFKIVRHQTLLFLSIGLLGIFFLVLVNNL